MDQFGNYVIQKALSITNGNIFISIIYQIIPVLDSLKHTNLGKKVHDHLMEQYKEYSKSFKERRREDN